jgi:aldehyde dehydrogenase (NAD+)
VIYEPLGVALIMGSWNFPVSTLIGPFVEAIAAGCCAILKPSELAPETSKMMSKLINTLDPDCFTCIEGGVETSIALTSSKFDVIAFTGSTEKGKLVAASAAKNLVPCLLELGGKSPAIVDDSCDIEIAAQKIAFGRFANCGQICISPDFVLCSKQVIEKFTLKLKEYVEKYWDDPEELGRPVNSFHKHRLCQMLDPEDHKGNMLIGNPKSHEDGVLEPTIILNPSEDSKLMKEEIFGPILPIYGYDKIDEAINWVNNWNKPLVVYYFGRYQFNLERERLENETSSGALI